MKKFLLAALVCVVLLGIGMLAIRSITPKTAEPNSTSASSESSRSQPAESSTQGDAAEPAETASTRRSMFSWEEEVMAVDARAELLAISLSLGITDWYQTFSDGMLYDEQTQTLLHQLHNMGIDSYYLAGNELWGLDPDAAEMLRVVDKVAAYNKAHADGEQLRGIVFDVEPYLTDEWDTDPDLVMQNYLKAVKLAYTAAQQYELRMVLCIPYWYDDRGYTEQLERLIAECSDAVSVMNYNRGSEAKSMSNEVELARKHGKDIECIFEFQRVGKHSLTEYETYGSLGLDAGLQSYKEVEKELGYNKLSFSYHYYKPIREMYLK